MRILTALLPTAIFCRGRAFGAEHVCVLDGTTLSDDELQRLDFTVITREQANDMLDQGAALIVGAGHHGFSRIELEKGKDNEPTETQYH